jgi:hypothetical protein
MQLKYVGRSWEYLPSYFPPMPNRPKERINSLETSRWPALTWLVDYVKKNTDPPNDFPELLKLTKGTVAQRETFSSAAQKLVVHIDRRPAQIFDLQGRIIGLLDCRIGAMPQPSLPAASVGCHVVKSNGYRPHLSTMMR